MAEKQPLRIARRVDLGARRLLAVAAAITTLIGLPLAILQLIDAFSGGKSVPPSARLTVGAPEAIGQTWRSFIRQYPNEVPDNHYRPRQLDTHGLVLPVELTLVGLAHRRAQLRWKVLNPTGAVGNFDPPAWVPRARDIQAGTTPFRLAAHVWVHPPPPQLDSEKIQVAVFDEQGVELAHSESVVIRAEPE